jgi:hypothetical protein
MKAAIFCVTTWCKLVGGYQYFGGILYLILRIQVTSTQKTIVLQKKIIMIESLSFSSS